MPTFETEVLRVVSLASQTAFSSFVLGRTYIIRIFSSRPNIKEEKSGLARETTVLLVMSSWLKGFYCEMNGKYSITLLFFESN